MTYLTLDQLLQRVEFLNDCKRTGLICGAKLTQAGRDFINEELSTIEAELDTRAPEVEFRTMYFGAPIPTKWEVIPHMDYELGFEPANYIEADNAIEGMNEIT